jgi:hypothetical protein
MFEKMEKGSLTIELTLLMPFILGLFILIIFSGFILHDKCVVNKACLSAALRGSEEDEDDQAINRAYEALDEVIPEHLIGKWDYSTQVDIGEDEVRITFRGDTGIGGGLVNRVLSIAGTSHSYECRSCRLREEDYLRTKKKSGTGYCL